MALSSDIHIQATETDPAVQEQTAVTEHRRRLRERLAATAASDVGRPEAGDAAPAALRDFARYARLAPSESCVPSWDYEASGPALWQILIGRTVSYA